MATRAVVIAAAVCSVVLSGCSGSSHSAEPGGTSSVSPSTGHLGTTSIVTLNGDAMVTCGGGPAFAASAMAGGGDESFDTDQVAAALRALVKKAKASAPVALQGTDISTADWKVFGTETEDDTLEIIVGTGHWSSAGPGRDGEYVVLKQSGDGWDATTWGTCRLAPELAPSLSWVGLTVPPEGLDHTGTTLPVGVTEKECSDGRNPGPFLNKPAVVETKHTVTVYWTLDSITSTGVVNCPGIAPVIRPLQLHHPLGDRRLLDGSTWPPSPVRRFRA